jgi:hypothetical protein
MWSVWLGFALVLVIWIATMTTSVPMHARLGQGADEAALRRLVRTNWIRTLAWTARGVLVLWMLVAV